MTPTNPVSTSSKWDAVRRRLQANAGYLYDQGAVVAKTVGGKRVWAVRFRVRTASRVVHRSIVLGPGDDIHDLAVAWLRRLREPKAWAREVSAAALLAQDLTRAFKTLGVGAGRNNGRRPQHLGRRAGAQEESGE